MSEENQNIPDQDEAALDAELAASIEQVKAGQTIAPQAQSQTGETAPIGPTGEVAPTGEAGPTGGTGTAGEGTGDLQPTGATGEDQFRVPQQGKYETDEAFEKRVELFDLVQRRRAAPTLEAKAKLSEDIKKAKGDLRQLGNSVSPIIQQKVDGSPTGEVDPALAADQARLRQVGGATKEEVAEIIHQERVAQEIKSDIQKFVDSNPSLKDEDVREVFFDFVESNYAWEGKSGKDLRVILSMAHDAMFRPSDTIQERVLKAANVAEKVNAMQFPGGTGAQMTFSPEMKASIDELKATGMSEEKAIQLLSE